MQQFRKITSGLLSVTTSLMLTGLGLVSAAQGAQLTEATSTLSDPRPVQSSIHTITFNAGSASVTADNIRLTYRNAASGGSVPNSLNLSGATLGAYELDEDTSGWSLSTAQAGSGILTISKDSGDLGAVADGDDFQINLGGIVNNSLAAGCDSISGSESCFIIIELRDGSTVIDNTTITYTVTDQVSVTATVDPILTFTVSGVASTSVNTNDSNVGTGTTVTTTSTTLPFGNVTVGTAKIAQQSLNVQTNANNGYFVYGKFNTTDVMTGNASASNNIDKFTASSASWSSPQAFVAPTGTAANINSAWLGVRTTDTDIAGFNSSNLYGPPDVAADSGSGRPVMRSTVSDNGTTSTFVSFKIQANAFQPADSYSSTWVYNVVPSY